MSRTPIRTGTLSRAMTRCATFGLAVALTGTGMYISPAQAAPTQAIHDWVEAHVAYGDAMTLRANLLANDATDPGRTLQVTSVTQTKGDPVEFTWSPDGEITVDFGAFPYAPPRFRMREVGFSYAVVDSEGQRDNSGGATFIQRLDYVSAGIARHDLFVSRDGTTAGGSVLANDTLAEGHDVEVISVTGPDSVPFTWAPDGTVEVDLSDAPAHDYVEFDYQMAHHEGGLSNGEFTVQRSLDPAPPVAADDISIVFSGAPAWWVDLIANDSLANPASTDARITDVSVVNATATHRVTGEVIDIDDPAVSLGEPERTRASRWDESVEYRVSQRLNVDFGHAPEDGPWVRTASVEYTVEDANGTDTAAVTLTTSDVPQTTGEGRMYWQGGPMSFDFDPAAEFEARYGRILPAGATVADVSVQGTGLPRGPVSGHVVDNGDGTWTHSGDFPTTAPGNGTGDDLSESIDMRFVDADGNDLVRLSLPVYYRDPVDVSTVAGEGEYWVAANGSVSVPLMANDFVGPQDWGHIASDPNVHGEGILVGTTYQGRGGAPAITGFSGEEHGAFSSVNGSRPLYREPGTPVITGFDGEVINNGALRAPESYLPSQVDRAGESYAYAAGSTPGTDVVTYTVCPDYPDAVANGLCRAADVTIHVVPRLNAQPDFDSTDPNTPVTIPVLDNDLVNDVPARARVEVVEASLPGDVTATVNSDRTVTVTAPEDYAGRTVQFEYNLIEPTLTSKATVTVEVGAPAEPPVVEPTPPTAVDDVLTVTEGQSGSLNLVDNDVVYSEAAHMYLVEPFEVPSGVGITRSTNGLVTVRVEAGYDGPATLTYRYNLWDGSSGDPATLHDEGTLTVSIVDVPVPDVDPPTPEPPAVVPPNAEDDAAKSVWGTPVAVPVLRNDVFHGDATVRLIKGSIPGGIKAKVDSQGRIVLVAGERLAGTSYKVRYRLTDATGKDDAATVTVKVKPEVLIVTGADRDMPVAQEDDSSVPWVPIAALLALLGLGGSVALRRRVAG
ncbi:hypothetical protein EXE59_09760 [Nocardioides eburneiflavus]|uniref:Cadherin-like domain-containing protein n=1 Tax=Nocardioides eburneiflavus TaxID=2518372 RepID=A0A4Z1C1U5_9ACTN|nr:Ig-like domain-containing protein [Nocardioides eburneiflavus]TGN64204.1 hypothetical protein EXE59_09760 [Nocardioides eburneiflavus]